MSEAGAKLEKKGPFVVLTGIGLEIFGGDKSDSKGMSGIRYSDKI